MNHTRIEQICVHLAELERAINAAPGWGAGVSVRIEERDVLRRELVRIEARAA